MNNQIIWRKLNKQTQTRLQKIKYRKGLTIIQDIEESMINAMPLAAKNIVEIDYELKVDEIIAFLLKLNKIYQQ